MESEVLRLLLSLTDDELLRRLGALVSQSRRVEAELVAHIGEADERRLFARFAFPSMFAYCTQALHLSDAEAYRRITVARAARRFPALFEMLRDGRLHLSGIAMLVPFLTAQNCGPLLERAVHLSKRQLEELIAELSPRPDVASSIRKLPVIGRGCSGESARATGASELGRSLSQDASRSELVPGRVDLEIEPASADRTADVSTVAAGSKGEGVGVRIASGLQVRVLSPGRYKVQFTASTALRDKLERLAALMRSEVPDGDLGAIIERSVTEKLERLEARRFAKTASPRKTSEPLGDPASVSPESRHIPASVRRAVYERDGQRCRYVDDNGRRCGERHDLEFHHRHPFGMGGRHSVDNVSLLCRAHNRHLTVKDFGVAAIRASGPKPPG